MNKEDMILALSKKMKIKKIFAKEYIDNIFGMILAGLTSREKIHLSGFGSFEVKKRSARNFINPKTKEKILINEKKVVVFTPSKKLLSKIK